MTYNTTKVLSQIPYLLNLRNLFFKIRSMTYFKLREWLFTGRFLDAMLKESVNTDILQKCDDAEARAAKRRRTDNHQSQRFFVGRGVEQRQHHQQKFHQRRDDGSGPSGGQHGRGGGGPRGQRYVPLSLSPVVPSPPSQSVVGARLLRFASEWRKYSTDHWVLNTVSKGLFIDFISTPKLSSVLQRDIVMGIDMMKVCDDEVASLLVKRAIIEVTDGSEGVVAPFFSVPKIELRPATRTRGSSSRVGEKWTHPRTTREMLLLRVQVGILRVGNLGNQNWAEFVRDPWIGLNTPLITG